jgi:hypothetical protein
MAYNPISKVVSYFDGRPSSPRPVHRSLDLLEYYLLLMFIPGMFVSLSSFVIVGVLMFGCYQLSKNDFFFSAVIFVLFGIAPGLAGILLLVTGDNPYSSAGMVLVFGIGGVWGLVCIPRQKRHISEQT